MKAYLSFLAISLLHVIGEAVIEFDSDADREWYGVLFIAPMLYLVGPMMQILGLAAFRSKLSRSGRGILARPTAP